MGGRLLGGLGSTLTGGGPGGVSMDVKLVAAK